MIPKDRLRRLCISQPKVKWSAGTSSRSRCNTAEVGTIPIESAGGLDIKKRVSRPLDWQADVSLFEPETGRSVGCFRCHAADSRLGSIQG